MPLSDQERRLLDEIEQGIKQHAPTPAIASLIRSALRITQSRIAWAVAFASGVALLAFAVRTTNGIGTVAGVLGYVLIVFAIHQTVTAAHAPRQHQPPAI